METAQVLLSNIDRLHTTEMGIDRIRKNLGLSAVEDVVDYCKNEIMDKSCIIYQKGKNWYCEIDPIKITVNCHSYTIITAHRMKGR